MNIRCKGDLRSSCFPIRRFITVDKYDFDGKQFLMIQLATADLFTVQVEEFVPYLPDRVDHISDVRQITSGPVDIYQPKLPQPSRKRRFASVNGKD